MFPQASRNARSIAAETLVRFGRDRVHNRIDQILNNLLALTEQRQKATDLVFGSVRNHLAIDMIIEKFTAQPTKRIEQQLLNIIRIAVYELVYCPASAQYAIVNEAVENAKTIAGRKQTGFVNAALRQITRHIKNRQSALSGGDIRKTLPQTIETGCLFDTEILPEPKNSPAEYLSCAFSLPVWLITGWLKDFGGDETGRVCFAGNRRPSIYLRANTLKTSVEGLAERLENSAVKLQICPADSMIRLKKPAKITSLPGFSEGLFVVQDRTAAEPVRMLSGRPGWNILELCAAPGTKTTQLAEITGDEAAIIATDIDAVRLEKVRENISRLGIKSVNVIDHNRLKRAVREFGPFDCVGLDVPCSNTGVLSRRPEVRLRITPEAIEKLAKTQMKLLDFAADNVKKGGKICYSTCSIQKQENGEVVEDFLNRHPGFTVEAERLTLPSVQEFDHDGGYFAIIKSK